MPQFNRNELEVAARRSGFTRDTFEKVVRLKEILTWISEQDILKDHLLLKGGTAINLTIFDLPRLSVDIDMDFTPNFEKPDMMAMRKEISNIILAYMESEGYTMSTAWIYKFDALAEGK
jgi:predicted nucleotidyltransferase component of viral defense system